MVRRCKRCSTRSHSFLAVLFQCTCLLLEKLITTVIVDHLFVDTSSRLFRQGVRLLRHTAGLYCRVWIFFFENCTFLCARPRCSLNATRMSSECELNASLK